MDDNTKLQLQLLTDFLNSALSRIDDVTEDLDDMRYDIKDAKIELWKIQNSLTDGKGADNGLTDN